MVTKFEREFTARLYEILQPYAGDLLPPDMGEYLGGEVINATPGKIEVYDSHSKRGFTITINTKEA